LVDKLDPQPGDTILDIAAGPGDTGFVAAGLVGDEGKLISTDFAEEMVAAARSRAEKLGVSNVEFKTLDAEKMDLPDDHVNGVLCRWGFMLMLDPAAALAETRRVLRPDGRLAFSVWGGPAENPWVTLMGIVLTQRGTPPQGDPWGPGGMFSLSDHAHIDELVRAAGYEDVTLEDMAVEWAFEDFDGFWSFQSELAGAIAALLEGLDPTEVAEVRKDAEVAAQPFRSGPGYVFPGVTINVAAR
jgi:SAM-dependent methyltransferase